MSQSTRTMPPAAPQEPGCEAAPETSLASSQKTAQKVVPNVGSDAAPNLEVDARLARLFRASRQAGLIHPLQHLLQRYRAEQARP